MNNIRDRFKENAEQFDALVVELLAENDSLTAQILELKITISATEEANRQQQAEIAQEPYGYLWFDKNMEQRFSSIWPPITGEKVIGSHKTVYTTPPSTQALIAAAYQKAAKVAGESPKGTPWPEIEKRILAITPADATKTLDDLIKQAKMEALKDAADLFEEEDAHLMKVARAALLSDRASSKGTFNDADLRDIIAKVKNEPQHP